MSTIVDTAGITVVQLADDPTGKPVFQWGATLGDGTKRGFASNHGSAVRLANRAKNYLMAVESHDPDMLERQAQSEQILHSSRVELVSSWGGIVEVNEADVSEALANGCRLLGDGEPAQHAGTVSAPERKRRGRPPNVRPADDM
jgi:hypothetical protein